MKKAGKSKTLSARRCSKSAACPLGKSSAKRKPERRGTGAEHLYAVIMAGGQGERFWPASRKESPKQLLSIGKGKTLIEQTCTRLKGLIPYERIFIITTAAQAPLMARKLKFLKKSQIIAEPRGRDTAAAIGLMAVMVKKKDPEAVMAVLPADHKINDHKGFLNCIARASSIAENKGVIVTIGIKPDRPATGYGYIEVKKQTACKCSCRQKKITSYQVKRFVEKPDAARAKKFLALGGFFWNSGMFITKSQVMLEAMKKFLPRLYKGLVKIEKGLSKPDKKKIIQKVYSTLDKVSIDYGVMEKAKEVYLVESIFDWDDVGTWDALNRLYTADKNGNIVLKKTELIDSKNCLIVSDGKQLIAGLGIKDLIIISHKNAVLVCPRDRAQEVKKIVSNLAKDEKNKKYL